jgi:hypothetical protein
MPITAGRHQNILAPRHRVARLDALGSVVKTLGGVDGSDAFARWLVGKFTGAPRQNRIGQVRDYRWGGGDESATAEVCKRGEALGSGAHVCLSGARWDGDGVELWRVACGVWRVALGKMEDMVDESGGCTWVEEAQHRKVRLRRSFFQP